MNEEALSASSRYISSYNSHNLLTFLNSGYDDGRKIIEDSISRIIRSVLLKENISMDVRTFCSSYYDMSKFYGVTHKRMLAKYQELQQKKAEISSELQRTERELGHAVQILSAAKSSVASEEARMSSEIRSARRSLDDMKIQLESRKRELERKKRARDDMRRNERDLKKAGLMSGWGDSPELRRMEQDISSY